jgi:hypothetical protein
VLASLLLALGCLQAAGAAPETAFAPGARWSTAGGTPARAGASLAPALRAEPEVAWSIDLGAPLEGEPLVWDGRVVAIARKAPERRSVCLLDLASGRLLLARELPSTVPLEPALSGDLLAVRTAENRVNLLRLGTHLAPLRSFTAERSISAPTLCEGELYLRVDDALVRYDLGRREATWTVADQGRVRGTPAVELDAVYALAYDDAGRAAVLHLARNDGRLLERVLVGESARLPEPGARAALHLLPHDLLVELPEPVLSTEGRPFGTARLARARGGLAPVAPSLHLLRTPPAPCDTGWVALEGPDDGSRWIATRIEGGMEQAIELAGQGAHAELLAPELPATFAGGVLYLGGLAADARSFRVLWKRAAPRLRPVPAEDFLLVCEEPQRLSALREPPPAFAGHEREARAIASELDRELADGYASLAQRSLRVGDPELTARLLALAAKLGTQSRAFDLAQDGLERLEQRAGAAAPRPDARGRALVLDEERGLAERPGDVLLQRAEAAHDPALGRALLSELLARRPDDARASERVRALLPTGAPLGERFDPRSWLEFLDVAATTPVRFVELASAPAGSPERAILERETRVWRGDLVGFRTDRLHVVTAPSEPGAVARALELGERVCALLEQLFPAPPARAAAALEPLTLLLYADQREYVEHSKRAGSGPEAVLGWTVGHYNGSENLSRMFVPAEESLLNEFLGTYAHELSHHWLATRAPFASRAQPLDQPGYWVAEGFATLVEEFRLDRHTGTWDSRNPRAHSLDVVANAPLEVLLPWSTVLALSPRSFAGLGTEVKASFSLAWRLGFQAQVSEMHLFYAQAGATAHYLFETSDATRRALIAIVEAWYRGDRAYTNPAVALGLAPQELGERVRAFARATVVPETP